MAARMRVAIAPRRGGALWRRMALALRRRRRDLRRGKRQVPLRSGLPLARTALVDNRSPRALRDAPGQGRPNRDPAGIGLRQLIAEDYRTHERDWFSEGFWALFWHRIGTRAMRLSPPWRAPAGLFYRIMFRWVSRSTGIYLPHTVRVGRRVRLDHFGGMILVARRIGDDVTIRQNTTFGVARKDAMEDRPVIGNRVEIGTGAVILGAVSVGDGAVIGANSVVHRDVAPGTVVGGVPAQEIRRAPPQTGAHGPSAAVGKGSIDIYHRAAINRTG